MSHLSAQSTGQAAANEKVENASGKVSLHLSLRGKKKLSVEALTAASLTVRDGGTLVDQRNVYLSEKEEDPPLITMVFAGLDDADTRRAAGLARKVLRGMSEAGIPIAVLQASDRVHLLQNYTTDRSALDAALHLLSSGNKHAIMDAETVQEKQLSEQAAQGGSGFQQDLIHALFRGLSSAPRIAAEQHMPPGIATLTAAAAAQKGIHSRKTLLFFTADAPSGTETGGMLRALYERLADASVSLYVIDVRGLDRNAEEAMLAATVVGNQAAAIHATVAAVPPTRPGTNPNAPSPKTLNLTPAQFRQMLDTISNIEAGDIGRSSQNPLASIAAASGGAYVNADEIGAAFGRSLTADLRSCYTLTFPASPAVGGHKFHVVDVRFSSKGVAVATPLGYLNVPTGGVESSPDTPKAPSHADWAAASQGIAARDLLPQAGLRSLSATLQEVAVQIPIGRLQLREDDSTHLFSLHATLGAELNNREGRTVAEFLEEFRREGAVQDEAKVTDTVLRMSRTLDVPAGKYKLHAIVRDWLSGKLGELEVPVIVAPEHGEVLPARAASSSEAADKSSEKDAALTAAALSQAQIATVEGDLAPTFSTLPSSGEAGALIEETRKNALSYAQLLPNFLCVERIDRSIDHKGSGVWTHQNAVMELLRYEDHREARTVLNVNGVKTSVPADQIEGTRSNGEFGGILQTVFSPEAQTAFHFERSMRQGADALYVFSFKVQASTSEFSVTDETGAKIRAGLHGLVYINAKTQSVRRLLVQTNELPSGFGVRSSWMRLEYSNVPINNHDYLLPTKGEVGLQFRQREISLLQLRFSDYRRFGSKSKILYPTGESIEKQTP